MPDEALKLSSEILENTFNLLKETDIKKMSIEPLKYLQNNNSNLVLKSLIEDLELSRRPYNCLKRAQINTIGDLLEYSPEKLLELKNFGRKSADEVFATLKNKLGIVLK